MKSSVLTFTFFLAISFSVYGQDQAPENWFNLDKGTDKVAGVSTEKTYADLLKGKDSETVIVAVIDSGVDAEHEDLKEVMWINEDEIPGNGIDDDKNGYIDDIHGWNFIGGKDGKNVSNDALEITRLVAHYSKKYDGKDVNSLSKKEKKEYKTYEKLKEKVEKKRTELMEQGAGYIVFSEGLQGVKKSINKEEITEEDLMNFESDNPEVLGVAQRVAAVMKQQGMTFAELEKEIKGGADYFKNSLDYMYNVDFDPRAEIVGDNYSDPNERNYGNNDVKGPDASHGTHVAGIIAAVRTNDVGIKGVADNVRIMSIRAVPDGDERDKDVANAIFYAVDNGATIINMSFGKAYSWDKKIVDKAMRYAQKNDVLLVHAAGNDSKNTDTETNFPIDKYVKKGGLFKPKRTKNWMEIGALSWKPGEDAVAGFSNYGKENVDLFAPGHQILSTTPEQGYKKFSGTSMAAPVVAGVAAMIRSYFPSLKASQVKEILMESVVLQTQKVKKPGHEDGDTKVSFSELCKTGGVVNAYKAVMLAANTKGKKKKKKKKNVIRP